MAGTKSGIEARSLFLDDRGRIALPLVTCGYEPESRRTNQRRQCGASFFLYE